MRCGGEKLALRAACDVIVAGAVVVLLLDLLVGHLGVSFFVPSSVQWFLFSWLILLFLYCT